VYYIYKITNRLNGKVYIGQTVNDKKRWTNHKSFAKQDEPVQYIHRAMKKYGVENFDYEVVAMCQRQQDTDETEKLIICQYDSQNKEHGYNISPGGDPAWNRGLPSEQQPMYGKKQSDYQKQKAYESHIGKTFDHTDETKEKITKSLIGHGVSEKTREKIAEGNRGKFVSQESRDKMSISRIGLQSGEKHPRAVLTNLLAEQIRQEYKTGQVTQKFLANKYSISKTTVAEIIRNEIYRTMV
jgi:group I intron endonuclease